MLPFIPGEEANVEEEPQRILGSLAETGVVPAGFATFATCTRVPVLHGHTASATVTVSEATTLAAVTDILTTQEGLAPRPDLPSSPERVIHVCSESDRPQPRLDRDLDNGMAVSVGRIRARESTVSFIAMTHNLGRGAAGAALQNAELLRAEGHLDG